MRENRGMSGKKGTATCKLLAGQNACLLCPVPDHHSMSCLLINFLSIFLSGQGTLLNVYVCVGQSEHQQQGSDPVCLSASIWIECIQIKWAGTMSQSTHVHGCQQLGRPKWHQVPVPELGPGLRAFMHLEQVQVHECGSEC